MTSSGQVLWCQTCELQYELPQTLPDRAYRCSRCRDFLLQPSPRSPTTFLYPVPLPRKPATSLSTARITGPGLRDTPAPTTVRQFQRYEILGELGRGGMGVVYRAWDPDRETEVALKVLLGGRWADRTAVERFLREASAASKLAHPALVKVLDSGEWDGQPFYAMELISGPSLKDVLDDIGRPPVVESYRIVAELADAVHHAHEHGVAHRDIKPENVLLRVTGEPILTDFGLVLEDHHSRLTHTGQVMGTPAYLAPELARGVKDPDWRRVDVYALGAMLYELLTGRAAYDNESGMQVLMDVLAGPPPPLRSLMPALPREAEIITQRAMARIPSERFPTAAALARDLERAREGLPIEARPLSASYKARLWLRANGRIVGAVAAALALVAVFGTIVVGARARMAAAEKSAAWSEAQQRLNQLEPELASLEHEGRQAEVDTAFTSFVEGDRWMGAPAISEAWRHHARRLRGRGDPGGELDALARAWALAPTDSSADAALDGLLEAMTARWEYTRIETLAAGGNNPGFTQARLAAAGVARRDLRVARSAWDALPTGVPSTAPMLEALMSGRPMSHSALGAIAIPGGELLLHSQDALLIAEQAGAQRILDTAPLDPVPEVAIPLGNDRFVTWSDGRAALIERSETGWHVRQRWTDSPVKDAHALDDSTVLVGIGPYDRHMIRLDRTAEGWTRRSAHPATDRSASDVVALDVADVEGDGGRDVFVAVGPWNAFDVRWFSVDDTGELTLQARRKLGYASDVRAIDWGGRTLAAVVKADQYPSRRTFPIDQPYGEPAGLYLLDPAADLDTVDHRRIPTPIGQSTPDTGRIVVADLDGDGREDLAFNVLNDTPWLMLYRQTEDGQLEHARIQGLLLHTAVQADDDPARELVVSMDDPWLTSEPRLWLMGVGTEPLPTISAVAHKRTHPPDGLAPELERAWTRAEHAASAGLFGPAANLFELIADRATSEESSDRAWLRAAELWTGADRPLRAAEIAGNVLSDERRPAALDLRARALVRAYRFADARATDDQLVSTYGPLPTEIQAAVDGRRTLYEAGSGDTSVTLDFGDPLDDAWQVNGALGVRRDVREGRLSIDSVIGSGTLARLPLEHSGDIVAVEIEGTIDRVEWAAGLAIGVRPVGSPEMLGFRVMGWGGGSLLERQIGCVLPERGLMGPQRPARPSDTLSFVARVEVAPRLREIRCSILDDSGVRLHETRVPLGETMPEGAWELVIESAGEESAEVAMHTRMILDRVALRGVSIRGTPTADRGGRALVEGDLSGALAQLDPEAPSWLTTAIRLELGDIEAAAASLPEIDTRRPLEPELASLMRARPDLARELAESLGADWFVTWHRAWNVALVSHPDDEWILERLVSDLAGLTAWEPADPDGRAIRTELLAARGRARWLLGRTSAAREDLRAATREVTHVIDEALAANDGPRLQTGRQVWMDSHATLAALSLAAGEPSIAREHAQRALEGAPFRELAVDRLLLDPRVAERRTDPEWAAILAR